MARTARPRDGVTLRFRVPLVIGAMLGALLSLVALPGPAFAAGTVLFQNSFANNTVNGTGSVTVPTPTSGTNVACLTAGGNPSTGPLLTCAGSNDPAGSGKLRLTNTGTNQIGGVFGNTSFPTSSGLDVTFNSYQWGGGSADGIAFMLAAVDPASPATPTTIGPAGGSLGYSPAGSVAGLPNAYLGVGLDVFGNFSATGFQGSGCTSAPNIAAQVPGAVVVRGPGNIRAGYCGLTTTWNGTPPSKVTLHGTTRSGSTVPVQVLINPTTAPFTSDSGVSVAAGSYKVVVTPIGQATKTLSGSLPSVTAGVYPSTSWLNTNGVPKQLAFAFVGSTGSVTDTHEISDVKVLTFSQVPQLAVATTSYSLSAPAPGDPVNYSVVPSVLAGAPVASAVTVTQTVPVGVVPAVAYGTGWVCQAPVGRTVSCTSTGSSYAGGTSLPAITIVAIVTGSSVTSTLIQNGSPTQASSTDAGSVTDLITTAGTPPAAPTGSALNPSIGPVAGGNTVIASGNSSVAPTAVMIGTAAEQQAGTPVVLVPCISGRAAGCFNIEGSSVAIAPMPARASSATVQVTFVTLGVAGAATYVYADRPATPAAPTATAGTTSVALSWVAPADNGSPITQYIVTPYLGGVAQQTQNFGPGTTSTTFTGLAAGGSWTYTVAAVNAYGTSTASAKSSPVTPYTVPGAPTVTAVSARNSAVQLTWTAPANGSSPITGYVVIPYIGAVAQPAQTFGTGTTQIATGLTPGTAYTFTVAAQNAAGTGPASARTAAVTPNSSPSLTFAAPPAGEVGVPYSHQLTVTNGTAPFTWSVSAGTLPAGLTLNPTSGVLSGTPTAGGSTTFTVKVTDSTGDLATRSVTLVIAAAPAITFTPAAGEVGVAYSQQPTLSGGTAPFTWSVSAGSLPAGLTINSATGLISGTPTASGNASVTISATDSFGQVANRTVSLVIAARPTFAAGTPAAGQVGVAYTTTFAVNGGTPPLTWSIAAGSAPGGLTLNTTNGTLSGTPVTAGTYTFTVGVVDGFNQTATKAVTLVIGAGTLVINKTADVSSTTAGSTVSYTISVANTGVGARTVTLQDPLTGVLDDATYNQNATASTGTLSYASATLSWDGTVAAGATATISYSVTVAVNGTGNKTLSNTATSSTLGTNCASGSGDSRCTSTVPVAGLTIVKSADVTSTVPGGTVRYQVVVTNTGPVPATGATFVDNLTGVLDDATYAADAGATSGSVSFAGSSLTWTGTLAAGASATITYSVVVKDPDPGNRSLTSIIVSSSPGSSCPSGNPAASCSSTVPVLVPALVITNVASVSTTTPGATVPYTVTISNTGQTPYTGASVSVALAAALDDATYDANAAASTGTVSFSSGSLTWSGNLATGAVATVTYSVTVRDPDPGNRTLTTVATSSAAGSTCPAASPSGACTSTVDVLVPGLTISTSANLTTTTPGAVLTYTLVATNTGQTPYASATFATSLSGVLDDATYNGDAAASAGSVAFTTPTLTWTGALAVGATVTVTFSVTVRLPDPGDRSLVTTTSSTSAGSNCAASSSDPACTTTVSVLVPGLTFVSSADTATTTPGAVVHYTLTVTNTGETTQQDAVVVVDLRELFDDATYNNDALVSTGTQTANPDGTSSWTLTLAPGASATTTVSMTVNDPDTGDKVLRTLVSSEVPGSTCPAGSSNPACRTTVTVLVPGLTITKSASSSSATPGDSVGYTITVVNNGQTTYPAATFTDDLTDVLTDASYAGGATATSGTVSFASSTLSWTGSLAPGASATIGYSVSVSDPGAGDKQMTNVVVSTSKGSNCAAGSTDPRCRTAVHVNVPKLTLVTTADHLTTAPSETVGYTVTVTNTGATAYTGATFQESLAGALDDATYVVGSATATAGTASYAGSTLSWTGNLAIGASATITFSVLVHTADGGNNLVTGVTTSTTPGNNCVVGGSDPRCAAVVPVARLVLAYGYTDPTTSPGGIVHFSATYINTGQVPYTGISVASLGEGAADDGLPGVQTVSSGELSVGATGAIWTGDIPVGGRVDLTASMGVQDPDLGDGIIFVSMESSAPGNNCLPGSTDPRCSLTVTVLTPELTLVKTASALTASPGDTVGYTITITNTGQTAYTDAVVTDVMTGVVDDATYDDNATTDVGLLSDSPSTLTWTGSLNPDDTATVTYSVTVNDPGTGDKSMLNPVSSTVKGSTCPPASGTPQCRTSVDILTPALTIIASASRSNATLGTSVTHTVTATNTGQTSYAAATFTTLLDEVLDDATYGADAFATVGDVDYDSGSEQLTWTGSLTPGQSVTLTYSVRINNPGTGDGALLTTVTSPVTGNNCPSTSLDPRCSVAVTVTNSVTLTFEKTADVQTTVAGEVVRYTITVTNSDSVTVADAGLTDPLAGILDDADYGEDADADVGTVVVDGSTLTWSGDLAPDSTATITYSVTLHTVVVGDQVLEGTISSSTLPTSNNCVEDSVDPRCTSTVPVAALHIQQTAGAPTATPGSPVVVSQRFVNTGKVPYTGISIVSPRADTSDDTIPVGDQTASSGILVRTATEVIWTGDIPVGGTVTSTRTLTVKNPDPGNKIVTAKLVSAAPGNNCPTGSLDPNCTFRVDVVVPGLTITKTADTPATQPGGVVGYTVTVHNTGQTAYSAATVTDSLTGVLDDATFDGNAVATGGDLVYVPGTLTWTGGLAVGEDVVITYSVTARSPATGDKTMLSSVASADVGSTCPPSSGASACNNLVVVLTPSLLVTSSVDKVTTQPSATVTYTLTATNNGQTFFPTAGFDVPLGGVLDDAALSGSVTASTGAATLTGSTLSWAGALAPGGTVTVTYAVVVKAVPGDFRLAQTVVSTTAGNNCVASGTDPRCSTSVPIASLRIVNSADVATTYPTGVVRSTATFTNIGQVPYVDAVVNASFVGSLDDATYNGDAFATSGDLLLVSSTGQVQWTGDLAPGASATVTGSLTVNNPPAGDKNLSTRVTTEAVGSNCPVIGGAAECATSVPVLMPGLTITKTADVSVAGPGGTVAYTITATNTGETDYVDASVSDPLVGLLNDADYNDDAEATVGSVDYANEVLTWTGDLAVDDSVTISFTVEVQDPYLGDGTLVNRAVSDELGSTCPTGGTASGCLSAVPVLVPALAINVTADRSTTVPGGTVGYTVTVHNGGQTAYTAATVSALLAGVVDDGAYNGDAVTDVGSVVDTDPDLTWTGDLAIGATATITYSVTVADPDTGDLQLVTNVSSSAPGSTCGSAPQCSSTVTVLVPGLAVSTSADVATATPGDLVTVTTVVTNTGQTGYVGTVVTSDLSDVLDDTAFDGNVIATSGVAGYSAPTVTWTGSLLPGASVTIHYTVTVASPGAGDLTMTATVVAEDQGSTCPRGSANTSCTATVEVLVPELTIIKSAGAPTTAPGSVVDYSILVTNTGQTPYAAAAIDDSLSGVLPDSSYNGDASVVGGGVLSYAGSTLSWTGALPIGATATITYSITVDDPDLGDKHLVNTVVSTSPGSTCPPAAPADACSVAVDVLVPALEITKVASSDTVVAGDDLTYTVTATNVGQVDYAPATVTDSMSAVLDDASYNHDAAATGGGSVAEAGGTLIWTTPLAIGATATLTYSVSADFPSTGDRILTNSALSDSPGSSCRDASDDGCTVVVALVVPALVVTKTADTTAIAAGGTVHYTITALNTGAADYPAAALSDSLAGVIDDATYNGDEAASSGTVSYAAGTLSWSGPLAMGVGVTITYSVTAADEVGLGDSTLANRVVSTSTGSTCAADSTDTGCVTSTRVDARTLELSGLTPSFTLAGAPHTTVEAEGAVTMTVTTNSPGGYVVTVMAADDQLSGSQGNPDTVPLSMLMVRGHAEDEPTWLGLSDLVATLVHAQDAPTGPGGDAVSNDFQLQVPNVLPDTYSTTLNYLVTAQ